MDRPHFMGQPIGAFVTTPYVFCIGVANVDVIARVDTAFLLGRRVDKGTSTLMRTADLLEIISGMKDFLTIPGGCAANTACGVAREGIETHFTGMIHDDVYGKIFEDGFKPYGVNFHPAYHPEKNTSLCLTLVTQDKDRSFVYSPDAASWFLGEEHLLDHDSSRPLIVYTESNLFRMSAGTTRQNMLHAVVEKYQGPGTQIILNLIDTEIATHHRQVILDMMDRKVISFIICNRDELMALFSAATVDDAFQTAKASGQKFITTLGKDGAVIIDENRIDHIAGTGIALEDIVDTVGAGDQFSAGFVAGLARGKTLDEACLDGTKRAIDILGLAGARPKAA
jgi:sugar/nucleoside kinase (ribokinase family)